MKLKLSALGLVTVVALSGCANQLRSGVAVEGKEALLATQNAFRDISGMVLPSVVEVNVEEITRQTVPESRGWPWDFMFPDSEDEGSESEREFRTQGLGSGVIIRRKADTYYVVTNNHVVGNADEISIRSYGGEIFSAVCIGKDERSDLALLSFESADMAFKVAEIGNSDDLRVGDWVLAFGSPLSLEFSVTAGIVSALHRSGPTVISDYIQTDAAINQGNSGGPLVNLEGWVVGINTWITTPTGGNVGLGFAIPINNVVRVVDDLEKYGKVQYGWLGVSIKDPYDQIISDMGLSGRHGAMVFHVYDDSPAEQGGILPGDYVMQVNGREVGNADRLIMLVGTLMPDREAVFSVFRNGKEVEITVKMGIREENDIIAGKNAALWPGFEVIPLSAEIKKRMELDPETGGLAVVQVIERTKADIAGLRQLDIIQAINGTPVHTVAEFYSQFNDSDVQSFSLSVLRDGRSLSFDVVRGGVE